MNLNHLFVLLDPERFYLYINALFYAAFKGILFYKLEFKGMLSLPEGTILHKHACSLSNNSVIVEIGCYGGLSTAYLLSGLNNTSTVYSIDPFNKDIDFQTKAVLKGSNSIYKQQELISLNDKPNKKDVEIALKRKGFSRFTLLQDYSFNVIKNWYRKIDLLWIDGNHEYNQVRKDFLQWSPFLKKGKVIVFHDANKTSANSNWDMGWDGPTRVVNENIVQPKWINIRKIDSMVYATKNYG
ncbi:MAG: class I SAM-dependent methyltransferase [Candidatus Levybacteria bacterium]|nr:class I SAM-dependent methyltransferase [Candidatus Levybacteria bacterium]